MDLFTIRQPMQRQDTDAIFRTARSTCKTLAGSLSVLLGLAAGDVASAVPPKRPAARPHATPARTPPLKPFTFKAVTAGQPVDAAFHGDCDAEANDTQDCNALYEISVAGVTPLGHIRYTGAVSLTRTGLSTMHVDL